MRKLLTFTALCLIATSASFAAGEVYRWKDANGAWHYSDQPTPGAEVVRGPQRLPATGPAASTVPMAPGPVIPNDVAGAPIVSPEVAQQVRSEAASAKGEQCTKAETAYQNAVRARRIYKTDKDGNRTFLTEAELDAARLQARSTRDLACGP